MHKYTRGFYTYHHLGEFFVCSFGCPSAYYEKRRGLKEHLLTAHTDKELALWGFCKKYLAYELEYNIDNGNMDVINVYR